ncbi:nitrite reductase small subunit NirD [Thalassotalea euphylliae]|uniref:nitrite reductase small subunit NirD n=1 Tax=Thalassotalea euphylliae TaxID=1655234 RepID=UPI00362606D2
MAEQKSWRTICNSDDLVLNAGVCALIEDLNKQIAIFNIPSTPEQVFAIDNFDPIGKANVLYRGIVGCNQGEPVVASPLYKQQFSLKSGTCLQEEAQVGAYPVRIEEQAVQVLI